MMHSLRSHPEPERDERHMDRDLRRITEGHITALRFLVAQNERSIERDEIIQHLDACIRIVRDRSIPRGGPIGRS